MSDDLRAFLAALIADETDTVHLNLTTTMKREIESLLAQTPTMTGTQAIPCGHSKSTPQEA